MINKMKRLLIPYVFVAVIWVIPISSLFFDWRLTDLMKRYLLCINPSQLWFLWMLFWVFTIVWPLRKVFISDKYLGCLIAIACYCIGVIGNNIIPNVFCIWTAFQYIPFFYIGTRIRVNEEQFKGHIYERPWYFWLTFDVLIFAILHFTGKMSGYGWNVLSVILTFSLHVVGAIMAWTILQMVACRINWKNNYGFKLLKLYSMPMYLFHQQIIYFMIFWLNGKVNPLINAGVNLVIAIIGSSLLSWILMRWKWTRFLIGEK